jgi:hypothetical protein
MMMISVTIKLTIAKISAPFVQLLSPKKFELSAINVANTPPQNVADAGSCS